jgi:CubicO group peptidase (beta-lactamase class C family)
MTPFTLKVSPAASADVRRRTRYLAQERGAGFGESWASDLAAWLRMTAENGAVVGTLVAESGARRTFGYRHRATILAEFSDTTLTVIRIYFPGHDWRA